MTNEEKQRMVTEKMGEVIAHYVEQNSPVTPGFKTFYVTAEVFGTKNKAALWVMRDELQEGKLRLRLGVVREGTDRVTSHFLPAEDPDELLKTLQDSAAHQDWMEQIKELSKSVDAFWG